VCVNSWSYCLPSTVRACDPPANQVEAARADQTLEQAQLLAALSG
jgi:hypothetical protein